MRIALAQTKIKFKDKIYNINKAISFIKEAKEKKADIIFFPEMSFTGFSFTIDNLAENDDYTLNIMKELSKKYNISIGFGYVKAVNKAKSTLGKNNYCIINKDIVLTEYTKIHPFFTESENFIAGNTLSYAKIKDITISTFLCYDLRFPEIFQAACKKADLIIVPSNWPEKRINQFEILLKARAVETQCYVAGINIVGFSDSLKYNGHSCIVNPFGEEIVSSTKEELIIADIDKNISVNLKNKFKIKDARRENLYIQLMK